MLVIELEKDEKMRIPVQDIPLPGAAAPNHPKWGKEMKKILLLRGLPALPDPDRLLARLYRRGTHYFERGRTPPIC